MSFSAAGAAISVFGDFESWRHAAPKAIENAARGKSNHFI
jgi:hypothetical protein